MNIAFRAMTGCVLTTALICLPPPAAAADKVNCESERGRYNFCRIDTDGEVSLVKEFSFDKCRQGHSWGYENRGVWVDRGCSAEFRVGRDSQKDKKAAIAVGVVGLAVIAAMAMNNKEKQQAQEQQLELRQWSTGDFVAFDSRQRAMVKLNVQQNGSLTAYARGEVKTGNIQDNFMSIDNARFRIEQQADGFLATDQSDTSRQLRFERQNGGR